MKLIHSILVALLVVGCARFRQDEAQYAIGDTVNFSVNGVSGSGVIENASPSLENGVFHFCYTIKYWDTKLARAERVGIPEKFITGTKE